MEEAETGQDPGGEMLGWNQLGSLFVCLFVLVLYVPSQQLWSLRDGQFT